MKVGRQYLGKMVELQWTDPNFGRGDLDKLLRGRAALATWRERGVVYDITDGVVLVAHSEAQSPGNDKVDEIARTAIPESLIERIDVFEKVKVAEEPA